MFGGKIRNMIEKGGGNKGKLDVPGYTKLL